MKRKKKSKKEDITKATFKGWAGKSSKPVTLSELRKDFEVLKKLTTKARRMINKKIRLEQAFYRGEYYENLHPGRN